MRESPCRQLVKPYPLYETREVHSVKDLFNYPLQNTPEKDAFRVRTGPDSYASVSWQHFKKNVDDLGTALYAAGLKGKHIAVIGDNMYEWVLTYMAALCGDMVIVPIDKDLPAEQIEELLDFGDVSAIIFAPRFAPMMQKIRTDLPGIKKFISMRPAEGFMSLRQFMERGGALRKDGVRSYVDEEPDVHKMAAILYTSGTTGRPKGVMLSQQNIVSSFDGACKNVSFTEDDVMLSILPLHHAYESNCGILAMLHTSTVVCFNENLKLLPSNLKLFSPTGLSAVPLVLETLIRQIRDGARKAGKLKQLETGLKLGGFLGKVGVSADKLFSDVYEALGGRLKKGFVGGAPANPETLKTLSTLGITFLQGYGITECSPLVSVNREKYNKPDSVGPVLSCCEVRIEDGEVQVTGTNVMLGYYKDEEATAEAFTEDGWFRTGDLGYLDNDGCLHITGREKNLIILKSGENISPEEIENLIDRSPLVSESVVMQEDDQISAHIYPEFLEKEGRRANEDEIRAMISKLNAKQPWYRQVTKIVLHDKEFEKTTTKKILRHKVHS